MDCREFRNKHVAFVDDLLPAVEMDAMQRHLSACSGCSRQDIRVRRSLMLVRSLPPIETSPDFMRRLSERIAEMGPVARTDRVAPSWYLPSVGAIAAFAAGVVAVAYMAVETTHYFAPPGGSIATPVVASAPAAPDPSAMANAAIVASVPTGIPVWPAVIMAGQSPMRFANLKFSDADNTR